MPRAAKTKKESAERLSPEDLDVQEGQDKPVQDEESAAEVPAAKEEKLPPSGIPGDYLWIYEISYGPDRQSTGRPHWQQSGIYVAPQSDKSKHMKEVLLTQPKVRVLIPRSPWEKKGQNEVPQSVCPNGYRLDIPKGRYVDLPEQIAETINRSYQQTEEALDQFRIDGDEGKERALR